MTRPPIGNKTPLALRWVGGTAAAIGLASATYQAVAEVVDRRRFPPPGQMVNIGGRRMHVMDMGSGTLPVVVVQALGGNVLDFLEFHRGLAREMRVWVYDRAGVGWSDPPPWGHWSLDDMAADLHACLKGAGVEPPYLLAGHSLGGVITRRFAVLYPAEVAGMLLIDSSHEEQAIRLRSDGGRLPAGVRNAPRALRRQLRVLGLYRLATMAGRTAVNENSALADVPAEWVGAARARSLSARYRHAAVREMLMLAVPHGKPPHMGDLPLMILTRAGADPSWSELQGELATLSTRSVHLIADKGGHYLQRDNPALVAAALRELQPRVTPSGPGSS